jgi:hypothetical protein
VSRSSLLLAEHPQDERSRVLARGKGNLSTTPTAIEFEIPTRQAIINGYEWELPVAENFRPTGITVEELVEASGRPAEQSSIADAEEIIRALIPADGHWHAAKPVYEAAKSEDIGDRTIQRAAQRLGLNRRRQREFMAAMEWHWPAPDTVASSENDVASVGTVVSTTHDTYDTYDSVSANEEAVGSTTDDIGDTQVSYLESLVERYGGQEEEPA